MIASAGGVEAMSRVLSGLPASLPAAVLIAVHISPDKTSHLVQILARRTRLPVHTAQDRVLLQPGVALVVPPGRHLLVTSEARIGLIDTGALPPSRPSADLLLSTLAVTCGPRSLAVVMTGLGHDGQAGVRAIAHCGGTVLAQDEASAAYTAMPAAAVATGTVRETLPLDDLAAAIVTHATRASR
ncbi:chemotaxis protein CheB [Actinoplanes ianthinogenes]|uniref:protein-glutamate methylesterase n=1 Tax=Actinoplanes ianthinogenes TaxID=122358 RepID=A0ABN6CSG0_9ACTN|nr:chemotaxis protein CheB [Actinoplanes ianthinogenes]GGR02528.1 chemotaxis protein CheB [Actinoplanes ianthinogenes]